MSLLTLTDVSKQYFGRQVLNQITFQIDHGERLALIGQNGAGKTTLMRLIMGMEKPDQGSITTAARVIPGYLSQHFSEAEADNHPLYSPELAALEDKLRQLETAMAAADQTDASRYKVLYDQYSAATARFESAGGYGFAHRMQEMAAGLGLPQACLRRPLSTLSGGERMRVELARLLLRNPDLLLLDEPTNHLDFSALEWLEQYLHRFKGAVIIVTHDRAFINQTATSVAHLQDGGIRIWPGHYQHYLEQKDAESETLQREIKNKARELERQTAVKQTMLSHRNISGYHAREKVVEKMSRELASIQNKASKLNRRQQLKFRISGSGQRHASDRLLLSASGLSKAFGDHFLFSADLLTLKDKEKVCICGPNGCGKTTLLSILLGRQDADGGEISLHDQTAFGHLGQHVDFADEQATVLQTLLNKADLTETDARTLLAGYGFRDVDVFKQVHVLSGGERARLYLCCLLLEQPDMLFLDEPTNHLDIESREILEQALIDYEGAILAVSHDRYFIEHCCQRVYGFSNHSVQPYDSYSAYRQAERKNLAAKAAGTARLPNEAARKEDKPNQPDRANIMSALSENRPSADDQLHDSQTKNKHDSQISQSATSAPADANEPKNPAEARKLTALRKKKLKDTEQQIAQLEEEKNQLEAGFGQATDSPDQYEIYARVLEQLETLYTDYIELAD